MIRKNQFVKMAILPKVIYRFNAILIQATIDFLHGIGKKHLKFHMKPEKSPHGQHNPKEKKKSWRHQSI